MDNHEPYIPTSQEVNVAEEFLKSNPEWVVMTNARYGVLRYAEKASLPPDELTVVQQYSEKAASIAKQEWLEQKKADPVTQINTVVENIIKFAQIGGKDTDVQGYRNFQRRINETVTYWREKIGQMKREAQMSGQTLTDLEAASRLEGNAVFMFTNHALGGYATNVKSESFQPDDGVRVEALVQLGVLLEGGDIKDIMSLPGDKNSPLGFFTSEKGVTQAGKQTKIDGVQWFLNYQKWPQNDYYLSEGLVFAPDQIVKAVNANTPTSF